MASDNIEPGGSEPAKAENPPERKSDSTAALPTVEAPSISPAVETTAEPAAAAPATDGAVADKPSANIAAKIASLRERIKFRPRHKRYAVLAASVVFAAALGAAIGATASSTFSAPAKPVAVVHVDDNQAVQQNIARLTKEVATLKANVEAANKSAHAQIARLSDKLSREAADITGSISAPQTVAAQPSPPVPLPKPRVTIAEPQALARTPVLQDWIIRDVREGYVYVQGHGDIYEVSIGMPLPGLGRVEQVKRQDGHWLVVTPKGLIVSLRDRRYFD